MPFYSPLNSSSLLLSVCYHGALPSLRFRLIIKTNKATTKSPMIVTIRVGMIQLDYELSLGSSIGVTSSSSGSYYISIPPKLIQFGSNSVVFISNPVDCIFSILKGL